MQKRPEIRPFGVREMEIRTENGWEKSKEQTLERVI